MVSDKRICFDVDGVLAVEGNGYADPEPYPGAIAALRRLKAAGWTIVLLTARYMNKHDGNQQKADADGRMELVSWLLKHDVPCDELYFGKPRALYYVDDRGWRLCSKDGGWAKLMMQLESVE